MSPGAREFIASNQELAGVPKPENAASVARRMFPLIDETVLPMEGELGAAGLAPADARFVAIQLDRMGYKLVKAATS
jgi:hypothetical protein